MAAPVEEVTDLAVSFQNDCDGRPQASLADNALPIARATNKRTEIIKTTPTSPVTPFLRDGHVSTRTLP